MILENQLPASPPPDLQRAAASAAHEALSCAGQRVPFGFDRVARAVAVELRDLAGNSLTTLSPSEAPQLAGGELLS